MEMPLMKGIGSGGANGYNETLPTGPLWFEARPPPPYVSRRTTSRRGLCAQMIPRQPPVTESSNQGKCLAQRSRRIHFAHLNSQATHKVSLQNQVLAATTQTTCQGGKKGFTTKKGDVDSRFFSTNKSYGVNKNNTGVKNIY
mmetsp:Transcript_34834/g.46058  ORF Transcript_34834/g.46058 Transcript_34834/m.46058 type:complete len:142 (+) Transcript_34834:575-1000(+)